MGIIDFIFGDEETRKERARIFKEQREQEKEIYRMQQEMIKQQEMKDQRLFGLYEQFVYFINGLQENGYTDDEILWALEQLILDSKKQKL